MTQITVRNDEGDIVRQDVLSRNVAVFTDGFEFGNIATPEVIEEIKKLQDEGFTGLSTNPEDWTIEELREFYRKLQGTEYESIIDNSAFPVRQTDFSAFDINFDSREGIFYPAVVQRVEYDHQGAVSSTSSVCGETENRRETDEQPDITIEGIITAPQLSDIKTLKNGTRTTVISDVHSGKVLVKRVTIEQNTDIIELEINGNAKLAFAFQLQLGQPDDDG